MMTAIEHHGTLQEENGQNIPGREEMGCLCGIEGRSKMVREYR